MFFSAGHEFQPTFSDGEAYELLNWPLEKLLEKAVQLRDQGHGRNISYSRKVFVPLTELCRNVCHYCTFAKAPKRIISPYLSAEEILSIAKKGKEAGCKEALFTLGDKPELRYKTARQALLEMGYNSTLEYLREMADLVFKETGLLPHLNPGVMSEDEIEMLRGVCVSMGIMLETSSNRLNGPGGCHFGSPDKNPKLRLETIRSAGVKKVPFTSGILIGIGENRLERIESLLALRNLHKEYGHLQEVIIQNFRAKRDTKMANAAEPSLEELQWTIAVARIIFGSNMSIQAPPNLSKDGQNLIASGINDWGGVSPVTPDYVNPEAPWPNINELKKTTELAGKTLVERLSVYPEYIHNKLDWLDKRLHKPVFDLVDTDYFSRTDTWTAGSKQVKVPTLPKSPYLLPDLNFTSLLTKSDAGNELSEHEIIRLFAARDGEVHDVIEAADAVRARISGETVSYIVTRNINYTNICYYKCKFCAFSKGKMSKELRGRPYNLAIDQIVSRAQEAWERGAVEVCLQGGIHPEYSGQTYLDIVSAIKSKLPDIHVHAFSPLEVYQGAMTLDIPVKEFLARLIDAGLGSLPGTAAEILDDEVRKTLCPDKINSAQWFDVVNSAHELGLKTTATIMFGHIERTTNWARHLLKLRHQQKRTNGFTELVPLPFVHRETPIYLKEGSRKGPTWREAILMHAISRLVLNPLIPNIQASWVKLGADGVQACLSAGVNDIGGTLMDETITRSAGAEHGTEMDPPAMERLLIKAKRPSRQRTTLYSDVTSERKKASFAKKS